MKILVRRVLVFALLIGLTSGLRFMPDSIDWHTAQQAEEEDAADSAYVLLDWLDRSAGAGTCQ